MAQTRTLPVTKPPPARPPRLLDLPDAVLSRICAYLARRPLFASYPRPHQDLPYNLLPLAATCHRLRAHAISVCQSLDWEPYSSWSSFSAWLRFASPNLRSVCVRPLPSHPDRPLRPHHLLPPPLVLSSLAFHAFPLKRLDLSGIMLSSPHDAFLLGSLLNQLRPTLTRLTLLDAASCFNKVVDAVCSARLSNLVSFSYLSLRPDCQRHLCSIISSFATHTPAPSTAMSTTTSATNSTLLQTRLTHLHLHMQESTDTPTSFPTSQFLIDLCPSLTDFTFASEFESPRVVPYDLISHFRALHTLTLKDLALDHNALLHMLCALPNLRDLRLEGCLIVHDDEHLMHRMSQPFLDLVSVCAPLLTSLWFPARCFSDAELQHLAVIRPPLQSLAVTLSPSALPALPRLCSALSRTLTSLRLNILTEDGNNAVLSDVNQKYIVEAVSAAPKLRSLHFLSFYLNMDTIKLVLRRVSWRLNELYLEVNPNECVEVQFEGTIRLLDYVAKFCRNLNFFCIENESPQELPSSNSKAIRLTENVERVLAAAPFLSSTNLRSLLSLWITQDIDSDVTNSDADSAAD